MNKTWQLRVYEQKQLVYSQELTGPAELGRQNAADEVLYAALRVGGKWRVVIAHKDEKAVSRQHALLEPLPEGGFRLRNTSEKQKINLPEEGRDLEPKTSCNLSGDALFTVGKKAIRVQEKSDSLHLQSLPQMTIPPGQRSLVAAPLSLLMRSPGDSGMQMKELISWLQAAMDVLQSATGSADFFHKAAQAMVEMVNLDSGRILLRKDDQWSTHAVYSGARAADDDAPAPSSQVLNRVSEEKRTFFRVLEVSKSLSEIDTVVAAPILDKHGAVIGALYGDRHKQSTTAASGPISELEAMLVEVLARGVSAGLARQEQEEIALAERVRFAQFFTPELARQLAVEPGLLDGKEADVTILFCDIRGFSRISERLGPRGTVRWIGKIMERLSACVLAHGGVLVDYIGDELMAMWGAPTDQPDHAQQACRAALDMLAALPELNARWQADIQEPMDLGIGINSGLAHVGQTGSPHKFKYGPLGNTVNLASRVQGATKHLKCKLLITGETHKHLDASFATRRLCQARVVNIAEAVTLHELVPPGQPNWPGAKTEYERALSEFEGGRPTWAARILGNWLADHDDAPVLLLLHRAVQSMYDEGPLDPVWVLPSK